STNTGLTINGGLAADGNPDSLITFTSFKDDSSGNIDSDGGGSGPLPTARSWGRIYFTNTATTPQSVMNNCVVKYSGDHGGGGNSGAIVVDGLVNPSLSNVNLYSNTYNGVELVEKTYSNNVTLDITSIPYVLLGSLTINSGVTLTMNPGVILKQGSG